MWTRVGDGKRGRVRRRREHPGAGGDDRPEGSCRRSVRRARGADEAPARRTEVVTVVGADEEELIDDRRADLVFLRVAPDGGEGDVAHVGSVTFELLLDLVESSVDRRGIFAAADVVDLVSERLQGAATVVPDEDLEVGGTADLSHARGGGIGPLLCRS